MGVTRANLEMRLQGLWASNRHHVTTAPQPDARSNPTSQKQDQLDQRGAVNPQSPTVFSVAWRGGQDTGDGDQRPYRAGAVELSLTDEAVGSADSMNRREAGWG